MKSVVCLDMMPCRLITNLPACRRNVLSPSPTLMIVAVYSSETSVKVRLLNVVTSRTIVIDLNMIMQITSVKIALVPFQINSDMLIPNLDTLSYYSSY
jgi:hypothetical protein